MADRVHCLELILGVADHGALITENQHTMATLSHLGVPFAEETVRLGKFLHAADELVASHCRSIGQICPIVKG